MKKIVSVILIISILAATFAVIFAGTLTAVAAESQAVVSEYQPIEEGSPGAKVASIVAWFLTVLNDTDGDVGIFSVLVDGIINFIKTYIFDVDAVYGYLQNSGIVEWLAHTLFPA